MNNYLLAFLWSIPGLLVATTMHEFVRALASSAMGDNLPKSQGRLTLNPLKHFEPIGFAAVLHRRLWQGETCGNQWTLLQKQKTGHFAGCHFALCGESAAGYGIFGRICEFWRQCQRTCSKHSELSLLL